MTRPLRRNRAFRLADLATLVRGWMRVQAVDAVFATCGESLFAIAPFEEERSSGQREIPSSSF